ncbi:MAG: cbb3-type cytochrome c oxidase subunit I [Gammaproteobacteria bacterium]|nr:cbb3-type cytochrome c oxidase subunit I [Gammaproteobacteria bacterium]
MATEAVAPSGSNSNLAMWLLNKKNWFTHFLIVAAISVVGLVYLGQQTYSGAPPLVNFVTKDGAVVFSKENIERGKELFHIRGLMAYGSFWGDGAERGPDFTAEALHRTVLSMREFYANEMKARNGVAELPLYEQDAIAQRVIRELHGNTYDETAQHVVLNEAQIYAFEELNKHYTRMFTDPTYPDRMDPVNQLSGADNIRAVTAFFYWGGWVSAANRPGESYSYTHNWPPDPDAGNSATAATFIWTFASIFALWIGISIVLYVYGQMKQQPIDLFEAQNSENSHWLTTSDLENGYVRPTQRATYKFFAPAMIVFGCQVLAGIIGATDFLRPFGINLNNLVPFTVARSYHTLLQIFWFFMCWVGYTIFFLPRLAKIPNGQKFLINLLFGIAVIVAVGALGGIYTGQRGWISDDKMAYWFGSQGWEFIELGRFFQLLLLGGFTLWIYIIYRGVKPWLNRRNVWSVPAWLLYGSGVMVLFLFFGVLMVPDSNFAISDYWRWMVVHMWVEVTFEVFTTVIVAYLLVQMGLVTRLMAERVIFLAVMLFFVTALNGISHNFYWIAKPTGIIAVGSVFSTLQVLPLLLLTLDAWQMRQEGNKADARRLQGKQTTVMNGVWLFILGVNFWNVFGAGVFGSLITLPIVNYYEHATYMTGNHAHAAMFGVKGNIAIAGMLFCCQHLFPKSFWNDLLIRRIFWALNIGIALMMFLDLFPVGLYQIFHVVTTGTWYARSTEIVMGPVFQTLTYLRMIGGAVFVLGGLLPLIWFVLSRGTRLRQETNVETDEWSQYQQEYGKEHGKEWAAQPEPRA